MLAGVPHRSRSAVLPREALGQGHVGKPLAVGRLDGRGRAAVGLRLGDGELELAGAAVEALARHDGRRLAGAHVVAVPDRVGALGHDRRGDRRLVRRAVVDEAVGVDGEHRGVEGAGDAHLHGDVADGLVFHLIGRSVHSQVLMFPGVANIGVAGVLPREALGEHEVSEFLAVGSIQGRGSSKRRRLFRNIEFIVQRSDRAANAAYANRCSSSGDIIRIRDFVIDSLLKFRRPNFLRNLASGIWGIAAVHFKHVIAQGDLSPINVFRPRRNSGHRERIPGLVHPLPSPAFNQRGIDRYPAQVKPIPYRNLLKSQTDIEHGRHIADARGVPARKVERDERGTTGEHGRHIGYARCVPIRGIEGSQTGAAGEHPGHIRHAGGVPAGDVEGGELGAAGEHVTHIGYARCVPAGGVEGRERRAAGEHHVHISHAGGVPAGGVEGGELGAAVEHGSHAGDGRGIPAGGVEGGEPGAAGEHGCHIGYARCVPIRGIEGSQAGAAVEHHGHISHAGGVPAGGVERGERGAAVEHGRHACGRRNIKTRKIHGLDERKIAKQTSRIFRGLNAIFNPNGFYISIIFRSAPGRITCNIRQLPHSSAIFRTNRQAALGVNHPFAAAPSLPAIGLGGGIVGFVGFPIGRGSRLYDVGRSARTRTIIFNSILHGSVNTSAIRRSIAIAGNAAGLHAVGLRARDATNRTGHSAIGGNIRAIDRSSSGAPSSFAVAPSCAIAGATGHSPTASTNAIAPLNARATRWSTFFIASPITQ